MHGYSHSGSRRCPPAADEDGPRDGCPRPSWGTAALLPPGRGLTCRRGRARPTVAVRKPAPPVDWRAPRRTCVKRTAGLWEFRDCRRRGQSQTTEVVFWQKDCLLTIMLPLHHQSGTRRRRERSRCVKGASRRVPVRTAGRRRRDRHSERRGGHGRRPGREPMLDMRALWCGHHDCVRIGAILLEAVRRQAEVRSCQRHTHPGS